MKKDAKIGLTIILGAVLLSALLIGKALQQGEEPSAPPPPDEAVTGATEGDPASGDEDFGGGAMDQLTGGAEEGGSGGAEGSAGGALADAGSASSPPSGADPFGLAGNVRSGAEGGAESSAGGGDVPGEALDETVGGWASPSTPSSGGSSSRAPAPAATSASSAAPAGGDFSYTVQAGDSAWRLAKRFFGQGKHYRKIVKANPGVDFEDLKVGTKLTIPGGAVSPAGEGALAAPTPAPAPQPAEVRVHKIAEGDNLWDLAEKYLGKGVRYPEILKLNPGLDPGNLRLGRKIKIPAR